MSPGFFLPWSAVALAVASVVLILCGSSIAFVTIPAAFIWGCCTIVMVDISIQHREPWYSPFRPRNWR